MAKMQNKRLFKKRKYHDAHLENYFKKQIKNN